MSNFLFLSKIFVKLTKEKYNSEIENMADISLQIEGLQNKIRHLTDCL